MYRVSESAVTDAIDGVGINIKDMRLKQPKLESVS